MSNDKIGRNDPCPCGSGKKYKYCCIDKEDTAPDMSSELFDVQEMFAEFHEALHSREFNSEEELQAFLFDYNRQQNQAPLDSFHGLSPEQMHSLLYYPFESPQLVEFSSFVESPIAPILTLFGLLADAIGEKGLKPTATGNLPRNFLREAALTYFGKEGYEEYTRFGGINSEPDFEDMEATRVAAEVGGLIRKYKGKFILSRDSRKLMAKKGVSGVYPRLLQSYAGRYNWGYVDRYPEIEYIQDTVLFTLYLLHKFGDEWRPNSFYEDAFLRAFPQVVGEVPPESWTTPEKTVRNCYSLRALRRFAAFLGLVELKGDSEGRLYSDNFEVRKLSLLDNAVVWHVP